ncbi:hypothetical protein ACTG9Q_20655 [Actinokineospora sp. 24-640]
MTRGHGSTEGPESGRHRRGHAWTPFARRHRPVPADTAHAADTADTDVFPVVDTPVADSPALGSPVLDSRVTDTRAADSPVAGSPALGSPVLGSRAAGDLPDEPATGLAKFDLGTIPASVTPPRTWRTAAWFTVGASALVLVGLVYAAAALVTGPRRPDVVDALPGLPTAAHMFSDPPETTAADAPATTSPSPRPSPSSETTASAAPPGPSRTTRPQSSGASETAPAEEPTVSAATSARPTRTTISAPALVPLNTDTEALGDLTEAYYRQVTEDLAAAHAMTAGQLYREGPDSIERRYAGVRRVEVQRITIDANRATTVSTLTVIHTDGTVTTMERELTFTYGTDPKISADSAAS